MSVLFASTPSNAIDHLQSVLTENGLNISSPYWKYAAAALVLYIVYKNILKAVRSRPKVFIGPKVPEGIEDVRRHMVPSRSGSRPGTSPWPVIPPKPPDESHGFAAIAGMDELKEQLQTDVINLIRDPQTYKRYGLSVPNGLLLYGPPGCGKTYFAKRFAEESGYSLIHIQASDIASTYVHGTESKIRQVFDLARRHAPCILYFDEINSMVPRREGGDSRPGKVGEVGEFLSQLDNIGESGVFVMASTNLPSSIDPAVLRSGRLEQKILIPPPDRRAREDMFRLYLKGRPVDFRVSSHLLADMTEGYVAADIKRIVDQASRDAIRQQKNCVTMDMLTETIRRLPPSLTAEEISRYSSHYDGNKTASADKIFIYDCLNCKLRVADGDFMTVGSAGTCTFILDMEPEEGGVISRREGQYYFTPNKNIPSYSLHHEQQRGEVALVSDACHLFVLGKGCFIVWSGPPRNMPDFSSWDPGQWYLYDPDAGRWYGPMPLQAVLESEVPETGFATFEGLGELSFLLRDIVPVARRLRAASAESGGVPAFDA